MIELYDGDNGDISLFLFFCCSLKTKNQLVCCCLVRVSNLIICYIMMNMQESQKSMSDRKCKTLKLVNYLGLSLN